MRYNWEKLRLAMADNPQSLTIILTFLLGFPALWLSIMIFMSVVGGWGQLASKYPMHGEWLEYRQRISRVSVGRFKVFPVNYGNIVFMGVDGTQLRLSASRLFRLGHAPIKIPYEDIEVTDAKILGLFNVKRINAKLAPNITITIAASLAADMAHIFWPLEKKQQSHPS